MQLTHRFRALPFRRRFLFLQVVSLDWASSDG
jgi:hypothetical protein